MPFTVRETRTYPHDVEQVFNAALAAIAGLQGAVLEKDAETRSRVAAKFPKTIHGKVLGDRTHLDLRLRQTPDGLTQVEVEIYPLDAIGRRLMFGARKGVPETVMRWFFAHLEHHLSGTKASP